MPLMSHYPVLELREHVRQVMAAAEFLIRRHSPSSVSPEDVKLLKTIILLHDAGKGSGYFQDYISNPEHYREQADLKSHSLLSALVSGLTLIHHDVMDFFIAVQATAGHHTRLRNRKALLGLWNDDSIRTLEKQLARFPTKETGDTLGINIPDLTAPGAHHILNLLEIEAIDRIKVQSLEEALRFRIRTQLIFSLLLEADKALLAVPDMEKHEAFQPHDMKVQWIDQRIGAPPESPVNRLRGLIRQTVRENSLLDAPVCSLTAPTGSGKTFLSATWAFIQKEKMSKTQGVNPRIIVVLPFLSIITQTVAEYERILAAGDVPSDGSWLLASHSLADRYYHHTLESNEEAFFIDTWRSDLIITTYDRFLYSLMDPSARRQMRFHNLLDAIIIFDEVQSPPARLWIPMEKILTIMTSYYGSRVLLMSATLPAFVSGAQPLLPDYKAIFPQFNRYRLCLENIRVNRLMDLNQFSELLKEEIPQWVAGGERVLITLNTRRSAQWIFKNISMFIKTNYPGYPIYFISSDVIPADRSERIRLIKEKSPCIVVSTQSIEAGVDIDMTKVFRDLAPLDSLIQIAGRCNRNGDNPQPRDVVIVQLKSNQNKLYCDMIYNQVHLTTTRRVLNAYSHLLEKDILSATQSYFELLMGKDGVDTGSSLIKNFAFWEADIDIKTILRGEDMESHNLCLLDRDETLQRQIKETAAINDRWKRREAWRSISSRLACLTISVLAGKKIDINRVAKDFYGVLKLDPFYYDLEMGFSIPEEDE